MNAVDDQKQTKMIEYDDESGQLLPEQRQWVTNKITKPRYEDAEGLLHFLDKYTTIVVGGARAVSKYYKQNRGKLLLDRLTVSDIAYSILVYESSHDVWKEEIEKAKTCATAEERKAFQHTAVSKYHVKRGTRLPLYQDGWTNEGHEYFKELCREIEKIKRCEELWSSLKVHWATYTKKYHNTYTYQAENDDGTVLENKEDDDSVVDDDCLVSLPGENDNEEIEDDIMTETEDEQDSNEDDDNEVEEEEEEEEEVKAKCARINNDNRRRKKQKMYPV
jgi:hypothetical protein